MSFFLPNMTFLQPPGYVHQAIDKTWAEKTVAVEFDAGSERVPLAAQLQASTKSLVVRMVNMNNLSMPVTLSLGKASNSAAGSVGWVAGADIDVYTIQGDDLELDNTPAEPTKTKLVPGETSGGRWCNEERRGNCDTAHVFLRGARHQNRLRHLFRSTVSSSTGTH
jgi:hypothetical protein